MYTYMATMYCGIIKLTCACGYCYLCSCLQACPIDSMQSVHTVSNSAALPRNCGLCLKRTSFSLFTSAVGRPGRLLLPSGVHYFMIFSPKTASLASFCDRVGSLASLRLGYRAITSSMSSRDSCMAPDGNAFSLTLTFS